MIKIPTSCPECGAEVERIKDQLYCTGEDCPAKNAKRVEHFAKTLKIKGLGPATIAKLDISSPSELYDLVLDDLEEALGSKVMADKLFEEIAQSATRPLEAHLPAMGIPLVGQVATDKLKAVVSQLSDITPSICKDARLGEKTTANLMRWINTNEWELFPFTFAFSKRETSIELKASKGILVITGKLTSFKTKSEASKVLTGLGYIVKDSVTKDTKFLVNESGKESAKTLKAREAGITIIDNLNEFIGED